jgi:hypothetical protein
MRLRDLWEVPPVIRVTAAGAVFFTIATDLKRSEVADVHPTTSTRTSGNLSVPRLYNPLCADQGDATSQESVSNVCG